MEFYPIRNKELPSEPDSILWMDGQRVVASAMWQFNAREYRVRYGDKRWIEVDQNSVIESILAGKSTDDILIERFVEAA